MERDAGQAGLGQVEGMRVSEKGQGAAIAARKRARARDTTATDTVTDTETETERPTRVETDRPTRRPVTDSTQLSFNLMIITNTVQSMKRINKSASHFTPLPICSSAHLP